LHDFSARGSEGYWIRSRTIPPSPTNLGLLLKEAVSHILGSYPIAMPEAAVSHLNVLRWEGPTVVEESVMLTKLGLEIQTVQVLNVEKLDEPLRILKTARRAGTHVTEEAPSAEQARIAEQERIAEQARIEERARAAEQARIAEMSKELESARSKLPYASKEYKKELNQKISILEKELGLTTTRPKEEAEEVLGEFEHDALRVVYEGYQKEQRKKYEATFKALAARGYLALTGTLHKRYVLTPQGTLMMERSKRG